MSNSPWRKGLMADPGKWRQEPDKVSPSRVPTWDKPKEVEVAPAKHSTPAKYTPAKGK